MQGVLSPAREKDATMKNQLICSIIRLIELTISLALLQFFKQI